MPLLWVCSWWGPGVRVMPALHPRAGLSSGVGLDKGYLVIPGHCPRGHQPLDLQEWRSYWSSLAYARPNSFSIKIHTFPSPTCDDSDNQGNIYSLLGQQTRKATSPFLMRLVALLYLLYRSGAQIAPSHPVSGSGIATSGLMSLPTGTCGFNPDERFTLHDSIQSFYIFYHFNTHFYRDGKVQILSPPKFQPREAGGSGCKIGWCFLSFLLWLVSRPVPT